MAAGRPIVASINGASKAIIGESNCGYVCEADDLVGFSQIMQRIIDNPSSIDNFGKNGRLYFLKMFTLEKHINRLEELLKKVLSNENLHH